MSRWAVGWTAMAVERSTYPLLLIWVPRANHSKMGLCPFPGAGYEQQLYRGSYVGVCAHTRRKC